MGSKILVVDDEADISEAWARALRIAGHDVLAAQEASTALELSRANPFDLVILDYLMPSMSGIELLNEIRKDHPFIRSIIISGKFDLDISEEDLLSEIQTNIEVDTYLHKPVKNSQLIETINNLLAEEPEENWVSIAETKLEVKFQLIYRQRPQLRPSHF